MLVAITVQDITPVPQSLEKLVMRDAGVVVTDRYGVRLNVTYQTRWNAHERARLHEIPQFLKHAFIISEDRRFYEHNGVDNRARIAAVLSNIRHMRVVRGASTITEQAVRMINPRPRTIWSRLLEGVEATQLEGRFSKDEILEFYLNQVPYAANRRGVRQAARYYFNRDLGSLSRKEMLTLAVLIRAPSAMDLRRNPNMAQKRISTLAHAMAENGYIKEDEVASVTQGGFELQKPDLLIYAPEFVAYAKRQLLPQEGYIATTLDGSLQKRVQGMLDTAVWRLKGRNVSSGAILVADHRTGEVLAWVVSGGYGDIDGILSKRQPGSTLKPFLYAKALEKGWTAATMIDDAPLADNIGHGLHSYHNYSHRYHGNITLRRALGNSLNIPAVRTLQYVGEKEYLSFLRDVGLVSLDKTAEFYGKSLALGSGEISLYELVRAYSALANGGISQELRISDKPSDTQPKEVIRPEAASLIGNILSDGAARSEEFGDGSVLNLPVQTAVKTGTSSDYLDAWVVGYNHRYTVGIWMGNLDRTPMDGVTGSTGPAMLLRSVFSELNKRTPSRPLYLHPRLVKHDICVYESDKAEYCSTISEWFIPGTYAEDSTAITATHEYKPTLQSPRDGLHIAYDPRIPSHLQQFEFRVTGLSPKDTVEWNINGRKILSKGERYNWPVERGKHHLNIEILTNSGVKKHIDSINFTVK